MSEEAAAVWVDIASLRPWVKNPRKNDHAVDQVVESIKRFGFGAPLVARKADRSIIAGHTRLKAALKLGLEVVPVRYLDLTEDEAHRLARADNKLAELAEWDSVALLAQLQGENEVDRLLQGFTPADMRRLMGEVARADDSAVVEDEPVEPPDVATTKLGDLWLLGDHRILCGDSTKADDVRCLMNGERSALMATDPPYLVDYTGEDHPQSAKRKAAFVAAGKPAAAAGNKNWDEYKDPTASVEFFSSFIRVALTEALIESPPIYQWHASRRQALVETAWTENGLLWHQQIIWVKSRPILTHSHFMWQHEPCAYGWVEGKPPARKPPCSGDCSTVWQIDQKGESDGIHPTQKPVEIFARPIKWHTSPGELCFEPFSGSGTQIIAAEQLGRRCYAMELEPRFVDAAVQRWEKLSGKKAELARAAA
jgi:DNA modification methylase